MQEDELPVADGVGSDRVRSATLHQLPWYAIAYEGPEHRVAALNAAFLRVLGGFNPTGMRAADYLLGSEGQGIIEICDVTAALRREETDAAAAAELSQRYQRATDVIDEVQRALLPTRLPVLPRLDIAAGYAVGGAEQAAGGDWFDVLSLDDDTVAAVVGDVVGHGVAASAVMAQLRAVALERLHAGAEVSEVVRALDRFVEVVPAGAGSTVCVLTLDLRTGELRYCCAGHPPPLLAGATGGGAFLEPSGAGRIGEADQRAARTAQLGDEVLLLYSDGIVERPGVPATRGTVELLRTVMGAVADELMPGFSEPSAVDRATVQVLERLTRETGATDDITLLALHRVPAAEPFRLERVIGLTDVAAVRAALRAWFRPGQVSERALVELDQIISELVENTVEHAYGGTRGPVTVEAELGHRGALTLRVCDQGAWLQPPQPGNDRGIGLALVQQLATAMSIDHGHGTEVTVQLRPWKHSHHSVPRHPAVDVTVADVYLQEQEDGQILHVTGPVDAAMIDELQAHLTLCTTPGARDLVIDLEQVTMLSSAAISVIRAGLRRAGAAGVRASVRSRPGTVAQQVLTLAAIPTATETAH